MEGTWSPRYIASIYIYYIGVHGRDVSFCRRVPCRSGRHAILIDLHGYKRPPALSPHAVVVASGRARRPDFRPRISADRVSRDVAPRETRMDVRARLIVRQKWEMSYVAVRRNGDRLCLKINPWTVEFSVDAVASDFSYGERVNTQ